MTETNQARISRCEAIARAADVAHRIIPYAGAAEEARRLPPQALRAIEDSGLMALVRTAKYGGYEADWMTFLDAVAEVGRVSGSIGWCMAFLIAHQWFLHYFTEKTVEYVYAQDANPRIVTSFTPAGGKAFRKCGGYVVSGAWPFGSGADHCDWAIVGAPVFETDDSPPLEVRTFLAKPGQFRVEDTWHSVGLKGSGSNDLVLEEVFVEEAFSLDMQAANEGKAPGSLYNVGPLYQSPLSSQFGFGLYSPLWAVGRGALESFLDFNQGRLSRKDGTLLSTTQTLQIRVGNAAADIDMAYLVAENINAKLVRGELMKPSLQPNRDFGHAARMVRNAVDSLFTSAGARGLAEKHALQRHWRDAHAMANHAALNAELGYQNFGRQLLGVATADPRGAEQKI